LRYLLPRSVSVRAIVLLASLAAAFAAFSPALAGAAVTPTGVTDTISIQLSGHALKFVYPKTVTVGDELEIVNETNPKQVGPHTFSLVTPGSVPKTKPARKNCFTPNHICLSVAKWQGFNKKEEVTINPAKAGPEGWSTMGSVSKKGDSWFTQKKGETFSQPVTATAGTTLNFICAVHPFMHGSVKVVAGPTT
jgi:hypothetical protein